MLPSVYVILTRSLQQTRHVYETRMPPAATKSKYGKICKSYILTSPLGHGMWVKCEQTIYELTVQVWLLYDHHNFKYCTLFVRGME